MYNVEQNPNTCFNAIFHSWCVSWNANDATKKKTAKKKGSFYNWSPLNFLQQATKCCSYFEQTDTPRANTGNKHVPPTCAAKLVRKRFLRMSKRPPLSAHRKTYTSRALTQLTQLTLLTPQTSFAVPITGWAWLMREGKGGSERRQPGASSRGVKKPQRERLIFTPSHPRLLQTPSAVIKDRPSSRAGWFWCGSCPPPPLPHYGSSESSQLVPRRVRNVPASM